jgi:hypothetical protein
MDSVSGVVETFVRGSTSALFRYGIHFNVFVLGVILLMAEWLILGTNLTLRVDYGLLLVASIVVGLLLSIQLGNATFSRGMNIIFMVGLIVLTLLPHNLEAFEWRGVKARNLSGVFDILEDSPPGTIVAAPPYFIRKLSRRMAVAGCMLPGIYPRFPWPVND